MTALRKSAYLDALAHRVLVYDGAMGTNIQRYHLTAADFGGRSKQELRSMERLRVHALFDEIQIAIYNDDHARLEVLMVKLALTTASHRRTN